MTGVQAIVNILQATALIVLALEVMRLRRRIEKAEKKAAQAWEWAHNSHCRLLPVETGLKQMTAAVNVLSDAIAPIGDRHV